MGAWDLVVFDNDGVLVDSERLANQVLADLLTGCGYPIAFDDCVRRFMGGTLGEVRSAVEGEVGVRLPDDFEDRYYDQLFASFRSSLRPVTGVEAAIEGLKRSGTPMCVASSARHDKLRVSLTTAGLIHHFGDNLFSAEDARRGKPAPDLFLKAAAACGAAPNRCLVVEDSPAGVRGAKSAGMTVIGYVGLIPREKLIEAGADIVIESMDELPDALASLSPHAGGRVTE